MLIVKNELVLKQFSGSSHHFTDFQGFAIVPLPMTSSWVSQGLFTLLNSRAIALLHYLQLAIKHPCLIIDRKKFYKQHPWALFRHFYHQFKEFSRFSMQQLRNLTTVGIPKLPFTQGHLYLNVISFNTRLNQTSVAA